MRVALILICFIGLSGCATIVEGTSKTIMISTNPPSASCVVTRKGEELARTTPGNQHISISKSRNALNISCTAPGYQDGSIIVDSSVTAAAVASIAFIDLGVVDYATGALNDYPETVAVTLQPIK